MDVGQNHQQMKCKEEAAEEELSRGPQRPEESPVGAVPQLLKGRFQEEAVNTPSKGSHCVNKAEVPFN